MSSVLFIQYSSISHLNAGFGIAESLSRLGYDVHYFVHEKVSKHVEARNFNVHLANTLPLRERYNRNLLREHGLQSGYVQQFRYLQSGIHIEKRRAELEEAFSKVCPSVLIVGTFASLDLILIWEKLKVAGTHVFYIDVVLSSYMRRGMPYFDSNCYPDEKFQIFAEQLFMYFRRSAQRLYERIIFAGQDNFSTIKKLLRSIEGSDRLVIDDSNFQDTVFKNLDRLVVVPDELEFSEPAYDPNRHVLGFMGNSSSFGNLDDALREIIDSSKTVIYIAFGTIFVNRRIGDIVKFLQRVDEALISFPEAIALVSLGGAFSDTDLAEFVRIRLYRSLPQIEILKRCHLFITHGGMNSIRESLLEGVPMLLYPLAIDQIGNARKIEFKGFGLCGDIKDDTLGEIKSKIFCLLSDESYRNRIRKFVTNLPEKSIDQILFDLLRQGRGILSK